MWKNLVHAGNHPWHILLALQDSTDLEYITQSLITAASTVVGKEKKKLEGCFEESWRRQRESNPSFGLERAVC